MFCSMSSLHEFKGADEKESTPYIKHKLRETTAVVIYPEENLIQPESTDLLSNPDIPSRRTHQ